MVAGKPLVRAMYPGTGRVRFLLVGRCRTRRSFAARAARIAMTRAGRTTARMSEAFFTGGDLSRFVPSAGGDRQTTLQEAWLDERSAQAEQNGNVLAYFAEQGWRRGGMELCVTSGPVHALQLIDKDRPFDVVNCDGKSEGIGFALAGQRTNYRQSAGAIVTLVGEYQGRPAFGLFAAHLRIKIHHHDVAGVRCVRGHHSTTSLPTSAVVEISS